MPTENNQPNDPHENCECIYCQNGEVGANKKIGDIIRRAGFLTMGVMPGENKTETGFFYTIGQHENKHPEFIMDVFLDSQLAMGLFHDVKRFLDTHCTEYVYDYNSGSYTLADKSPLRMKLVKLFPEEALRVIDKKMCGLIRRYGCDEIRNIAVYQLVVADVGNLLPWEPGYAADFPQPLHFDIDRFKQKH